MENIENKIFDHRHSDKALDIKPEDISPEQILAYRNEHEFGVNLKDEEIIQLIINDQGGPVYRPKQSENPQDPEDRTFLTYRGTRKTHDLTNEIYEDVTLSPRGRICLFTGSPSGRTMETMTVIEERVDDLLKRDQPKGIKILKTGNIDALVSENIDPQSTYFVFVREGAEKIAPFENKMLGVVSKAYGDTMAEMLWFAKPGELPDLPKGIKQKDFEIPPEEIIDRIVAYYEQLIDLVNQKFPDRQVDIHNISHNMILDAAAIRMLGMEISAASVKKLGGKARESLETSEISIISNELTVKFRGLENKLSIEDLKNLREVLKKESAERREQWEKQ